MEDPDADAAAAAAALPAKFASETGRLRDNYRRLYRAFCGFTVWLHSWENLTWLLPWLLCGPLLFDEAPERRITMGTMSRTSQVLLAALPPPCHAVPRHHDEHHAAPAGVRAC